MGREGSKRDGEEQKERVGGRGPGAQEEQNARECQSRQCAEQERVHRGHRLSQTSPTTRSASAINADALRRNRKSMSGTTRMLTNSKTLLAANPMKHSVLHSSSL